MNCFTIDPEIATRLPTMRVVIVAAYNLDNTGSHAEVTKLAEETAHETLTTLTTYPNAQSHPRIALYRSTLKASCDISPKKYPQSNESLYRRLLKARAPLRSINPVVDFYNTLSLKHGVTAGAFDLGALQTRSVQPLELRLSVPGDMFRALDAGEGEGEKEVPQGEVVYVQEGTVVTRALAWRQAEVGLVGAETRDVLFMSEVLEEEGGGGGLAARVAEDFVDGLRRFWGVEGQACVLGQMDGKLSVGLHSAFF